MFVKSIIMFLHILANINTAVLDFIKTFCNHYIQKYWKKK